MKSGQRVRTLGIPYEGRTGVIEAVDSNAPNMRHWPVWVVLDGNAHAVGFEKHEVEVIVDGA